MNSAKLSQRHQKLLSEQAHHQYIDFESILKGTHTPPLVPTPAPTYGSAILACFAGSFEFLRTLLTSSYKLMHNMTLAEREDFVVKRINLKALKEYKEYEYETLNEDTNESKVNNNGIVQKTLIAPLDEVQIIENDAHNDAAESLASADKSEADAFNNKLSEVSQSIYDEVNKISNFVKPVPRPPQKNISILTNINSSTAPSKPISIKPPRPNSTISYANLNISQNTNNAVAPVPRPPKNV